jgi:hypothetical protein
MRDEAKKTQRETERAAQPMPGGGEMRERGAMPMDDQGSEVAGHAQTMTDQPAERGAMAEQDLQPGTEGRPQQRTVSQQPEQPI